MQCYRQIATMEIAAGKQESTVWDVGEHDSGGHLRSLGLYAPSELTGVAYLQGRADPDVDFCMIVAHGLPVSVAAGQAVWLDAIPALHLRVRSDVVEPIDRQFMLCFVTQEAP